MSQSTRRHNPPTAPAPRTPRARARRCSQGGRLGRTRSGPSQTWHLPGTIALSHAALSSNRIQPEHHRARQPSPTVSAPNPGAPPTRLPRKPGREGTATVHPRSPPFHLPRSALHSSPQSSGLMLRPQAARGRPTFCNPHSRAGQKICLPPSVIDLIRSSPRRRLRRRTVAGGVGATLRISSVFPLTVADRGAAGSDASVVSNTRLNSWKVG